MIEHINSFLLLTLLGIILLYLLQIQNIFGVINIVVDSAILDQLNNLEKEINYEVTKSKRGRKKKTDTKINEEEENDIRDKRERPVACILWGNSKKNIKEYIGKKEHTLNSKLMKWTAITSIYCYIGTNLF